MKKPLLAFAVMAAIAILAGCGKPTTAAEIDRIMAEARRDAARDQAHARNAWAGNQVITARAPPEDQPVF